MKINKFKEGETVFAKAYPDQELVVRSYKGIYYCRAKNDLQGKDLVYFERELTSGLAAK